MDNDTKIINKITEIKADDVVNSSEYANSQKLHKKVFQILICISLVFYIPGIVFFTLFIYFFSIYLDYPSLILGIVFLSLAIIFSLLAY
jgi:hypothetical protein